MTLGVAGVLARIQQLRGELGIAPATPAATVSVAGDGSFAAALAGATGVGAPQLGSGSGGSPART